MVPVMPTYLHQIIAVQRGADAEAKRRLEELRRVLGIGGDQDPITGLTRTHEPISVDEIKLPDERRLVQFTVPWLLGSITGPMTRQFDLDFTREYANCAARASVIIDGETILEDVPTGFLLFLENQLQSLITGVIDKIPVLDPAEEWHDASTDPSLPHGVYASTPRQRHSTGRRRQVQKLAPATKEHPEQVLPYESDVVTGTWTHVKFSGQLPATVVQDLRERATRAMLAVRYAREQANRLEVTDRTAGREILGYVFGDLATQRT